uniref:C-type lectin domain-containing protein n=1 Tax=Caenorhabditis tropicalis TaxID=1561998 RepID=A0A1I7U1F8_9PELO
MNFLLLLSLIGITVAVYSGGRHFSSSEEYGRPSRPRPPNRPPSRPRPPPARGCESGWMTFNRPQGTWCVKVFWGPIIWNAAQNACGALGAKLTGLQDANERMQVANAGRALSLQYGGGLQEIIIDGIRRPECPRRNSCPKLTTFQWTDGHTTGTDGFYWPGQEPNAMFTPGRGLQSVIIMHISPRDGMIARYGYPHGSLDDAYFNGNHNMHACGKRPS